MSRSVRLSAVSVVMALGFLAGGVSWWRSQAKVSPHIKTPQNAVPGSPSISIPTLGAPIIQNFDTLAQTGTPAWTDDTTLAGWYAQFSATPANPTTYTAGTGSSNSGALYSFGIAGTNPVTDRALGAVSSGTPATIYFALKLTNNTGSSIGSLSISYNGEQWRDGGAPTPAAQTTNFQYQVAGAGTITDANTPSTGWTTFSSLSFTSPTFTNTGAGAALDGNAAANRTAKSATLTFGTPVAAGQEIWIRWEDINDSGNDHGLAVDDLIITAFAPLGFTVNSLLDTSDANPGNGACATSGGVCTLRAAIEEINAIGGSTTYNITFSVTGTITLGSSLPNINHKLNVVGPGSGSLTINGNDTFRLLEINSLLTASISGVTMSHGNAVNLQGGAIESGNSVVTLSNSVFDHNAATFDGGAIRNNGGNMTITNCTFSNNTSGVQGGAVKQNGTAMSMTGSTFFANTAAGGGGLHVGTGSTNTTVTNTTFYGNNAGIGGAAEARASATFRNCTFTRNVGSPGGLNFVNQSSTLVNTIVAGNTDAGNNPSDLNATSGGSVDLAASFNNLVGNVGNTALTNGLNGNQTGVTSPGLTSLGNYGGTTQTVALLCSSPAKDAGTNTSAPATDQRGVTRPNNTTTDVGAFETNVTLTVPTTTLPGGAVGTAYSQTLNAATGGTAPYVYGVVDSGLPPGLSLSTAGQITGTPTATGTFNFSVVAVDSLGAQGCQSYSIVVGVTQYRSVATGAWNNTATWESSPDGATWTAATSTPTAASGAITIRTLNNVSITAAVDADQLTISSGGNLTVNSGVNFTVADGAGTDLTAIGNLFVSGTLTNNGQIAINSSLTVGTTGNPGAGTGSYSYDPAASLNFTNTGASYVTGNVSYWPTTNGPQSIVVFNSGGITLNAPRTVNSVSTSAGISGANNLTVNGTFTINAGGFVSGSPTYGPSSLLVYATNGSYGRAGEWLPGVISGAGYPANVSLTLNTNLDLPNGSNNSTFQVAGGLTVNSGCTLQMAGSTPMTLPLTVLGAVNNSGTINLSTAAGGDLKMQGDYIESGGTGTINGNNGFVRFEGGNNQTLVNGNGSMNLPKTVINKTAGTVMPSGVNVSINDVGGGNSLTFATATSTYTIGNQTLTLGGLLPAPPVGAGLIGSQNSNLILNDGGATGDMGTVRFVFPQSLKNLTVNRTTATGNITLGNAVGIYGVLTLTAGTVTNGNNVIEMNTPATMTRTNGYVIGAMQKDFNATGSFTFPVGTASGYYPVDANVTAGPGSLLVRPIASAEPTLNPTHSLGRYWILNGTGITTNLVFHYLDGDVNGNEATYRIIRVSSGTAITFPNACPAAPCVDTAANTATINGVNHFSNWTVGEPLAPTAAPAELSGHVFASPGGRPMRGVEVRLQNLTTGAVAVTLTDAKGRYTFPSVDTGVDYLVTPLKPGYSFGPASQLLTHSGSIGTVDFIATPDPGLAPAKPTRPPARLKVDRRE